MSARRRGDTTVMDWDNIAHVRIHARAAEARIAELEAKLAAPAPPPVATAAEPPAYRSVSTHPEFDAWWDRFGQKLDFDRRTLAFTAWAVAWDRSREQAEALRASAPPVRPAETTPVINKLRDELATIKGEAWRWVRLLDERRGSLSLGEWTSLASCLRALYCYGLEVYDNLPEKRVIEAARDQALLDVDILRRDLRAVHVAARASAPPVPEREPDNERVNVPSKQVDAYRPVGTARRAEPRPIPVTDDNAAHVQFEVVPAREAPSEHQEQAPQAGLPMPSPVTDAEVIVAVRTALWEHLRGRELGGDRTIVGMINRLAAERDEAQANRRGEFELRLMAEAQLAGVPARETEPAEEQTDWRAAYIEEADTSRMFMQENARLRALLAATGSASPRDEMIPCPKCGDATANRKIACGICGWSWDLEYERASPPASPAVPVERSPDPSCHACGGPIELGEPIAIYHESCDKRTSSPLVERSPEYRALIKAAQCEHENRTGGNDYILCHDCHLIWDYRREGPNDALVRELTKFPPSAAPPQEGAK